jgi:hypothetical protein
MTNTEIETRLRAWHKRYVALWAQIQALDKLTGCDYDCDLLKPILDTWGAYTVAISEIVGDYGFWLEYYQDDCQMGRRPMLVVLTNGTEIKLKTLKQLARVIKS